MTTALLITAMLALMPPAPPPAITTIDVTGIAILQNGHILLTLKDDTEAEVRSLPVALTHWLDMPPSGTTRCTILRRPEAVSELLSCAQD